MNLFNVISDYIKSGKVDLAEKSTTKVKYPDWALQTADAERFNLPDLSLYGNQAELYQRLSWVNTAVTMTAQTGALAPFSVFQLENENKIEVINHPFELLMQKPNPADSRFEFLRATYSARKLTGNAYWWLNMPMKNEPPTEIWFIPPDRIMPKPDKNMYLEGYAYDPGDGQLIALLPNEIVHFRGYNPKNRFVGMSAIECLAVVAIGDMKMQDWNTRLFGQNNARLPGVLSFGDMIPDPEWKRMLSEAEDKAAKRQIMMLRGVGTGAVTYQNIAANPKDMEFLAGRTMNKEEIWSVLAPGLVSMLDKNATEANSKTGERTFREHTVYPLIVEIAEKITSEILPYWGENLRGEFEDIRITDRQLELAEIETFSRTHTIDEIRHEKYNDDPIGDERGKLLIVEISKPILGNGQSPTEPPAPDGGKPGELPQPKPEEKPAEKSDDGYRNALTLWRRRALRKQKEADIGKFDHEAISPVVNQAIKTQLEMAGACVTKQEREKAINDIFDEFMDVTITYPSDLFSNEPREKIRISGEIDKLVKMVEIGIDAMKGGEGSGFYEHEGRPGEVGGSLPEGEHAESITNLSFHKEKSLAAEFPAQQKKMMELSKETQMSERQIQSKKEMETALEKGLAFSDKYGEDATATYFNYNGDANDEYMKTIDGMSDTEMIAFHNGINGKKGEFEFVTAWRVGTVPESGMSYNFSEQKIEGGVSVMATSNGLETGDLFSAMFILSKNRPIVFLSGFVNPFKTGGDGEPLILQPKTLLNVSEEKLK